MRMEAELIGKKIESIKLSDSKETLTVIADGIEFFYRVEGACCSSSWIEHLEGAENIVGSVVTAVESLDMEGDGNKDHCEKCKESDCLRVYQVLIKTDKGTATLEFRNNSNGYYGGYIV